MAKAAITRELDQALDNLKEEGADPWEAIRLLLARNERLEQEVERLTSLVSPGYGRLPPTRH